MKKRWALKNILGRKLEVTVFAAMNEKCRGKGFLVFENRWQTDKFTAFKYCIFGKYATRLESEFSSGLLG